MQKERASKKQQELLSFVDGFIKGNGYGPSYREIMRALGYKSVSTVAIHIDGLIAKGYLARRDNSARSLEVVTTRTANDSTAANVSNDLQVRIQAASLTDEQSTIVREALELLGYTDVAATLQNKNNDTTKSDSSSD